MKNASYVVVLGLFCAPRVPAWSQNQASPAQNPLAAESLSGVSLANLLQLQTGQIERLNRLERGFMIRQNAGNAKIAELQEQLIQPGAGDALRAARIQSEIEAARRKMALDLGASRVEARELLPPVQRSQLDSLASDPRFRVRRDSLYQLLLGSLNGPAPLPNSASPAVDEQARRNWLDARRLDGQGNLSRAAGIGSYGVYGGLGRGGPQVGVYGGYQQGAVGVYGGLGRSGPTIGVNIGRIFGVGRR